MHASSNMLFMALLFCIELLFHVLYYSTMREENMTVQAITCLSALVVHGGFVFKLYSLQTEKLLYIQSSKNNSDTTFLK